MTRLSKRLEYTEIELDLATSATEILAQVDGDGESREAKHKKVFSQARFRRVNMRGVTIVGEFQYAFFDSCVLENANLSGGDSAFQFARFDNSNLVKARLTGGSSAFQMSSFVDADLSGAVLTGGGSSFQRARFQRAKLIGARIVCPAGTAFQAVNLDSVQFQGADLSAIDRRALESCFFDTPPSYDGETRLPRGFDPDEHLWKKLL